MTETASSAASSAASAPRNLAAPAPAATDRAQILQALAAAGRFDLLVIGGGATGLGVALDAAARGLSVALLEAHDFAKGTSSRATKLVHGGVRYLAQGNIALVREALQERAILLRNAPHLARPLPFVMPSYRLWETPFYGAGLRVYDMLAAGQGLGATQFLSRARVQALLGNVNPQQLRGGVQYWDGQFDDARLALALARTAALHGALLLNYCRVTGLLKDGAGRVCGAQAQDEETGAQLRIEAGCVINATGVWVDAVRSLDETQNGQAAQPMVSPSQGTHVVVERRFWPGEHALLVPKTRDGRVLFAVPWLGKVILGTTDSARPDTPLEPRPLQQEVGFILDEARRYLAQAPGPGDVLSMWAGLRPLVKPLGDAGGTKSISREHTVHVAGSGLVTVTGGKWTTYRAMAEDVLRHCQLAQLLPTKLPPSATRQLPLVGHRGQAQAAPAAGLGEVQGLAAYGDEAAWVQALPGADAQLAPQSGLSEAMVRFAARYEYARTVEDVLARRNRLLFLHASAAQQASARVAQILSEELGQPVSPAPFEPLCQQYQGLA